MAYDYLIKLTTAELARTIGSAKALSNMPDARKNANSIFGLVMSLPPELERCAMKTGRTVKT